MTGGDIPTFDPELLEVGGEALVLRLRDEESGAVVRAVVRQRLDLHNWFRGVLLVWGDGEVNYIHLLLLMLPELWLRYPEGAASTLWQLLDDENRPPSTVNTTREWLGQARTGALDHDYPSLSMWLLAQGL